MWPTFSLGFSDFMPITGLDFSGKWPENRPIYWADNSSFHSEQAPRSNPRLLDQSGPADAGREKKTKRI